jgi:hypothetical protein
VRLAIRTRLLSLAAALAALGAGGRATAQEPRRREEAAPPRAAAPASGPGTITGYDGATPFLLRGTVSGRLWPGLVPGAGVEGRQRRANLAALQAAVTHAVENRRFFELEPGLYEIEGAEGLIVPPNKDGFVWRGAKGSLLKQFSDNAPILTLGDVRGSREIQDMDFRGVRLFYAADQSQHVASSALQIGIMRNSTVEQIAVHADYAETGPRVKAHRGIHIVNARHPFGFFSNTVKDVMVGGAALSLLDIALVGTGSVFSNIYLTQGVTGHPHPISGVPLRIAGAADLYESVFQQLNIEWCIANTLIHTQSCRATTFLSTHLEGNRLVGWSPRVMTVAASSLVVTGFNMLDQEIRRAEVTGGTVPSVFQCYADTSIVASGVEVSWSARGRVNMPFYLVAVSGNSPPGAQQTATVTGFGLRDIAGDNQRFFGFDANLSRLEFAATGYADRYTRHDVFSEVTGARFRGNGDVTVHGDHQSPLLCFPAALGARRVVTLSGRLRGQGPGSALPARAGTLVGIRREAGDGDAHDLLVRGADGRALATIRAVPGGSTRWFRFDGNGWPALD